MCHSSPQKPEIQGDLESTHTAMAAANRNNKKRLGNWGSPEISVSHSLVNDYIKCVALGKSPS